MALYASTGIGEATARRLDKLGWHVFAGVRRDEDGERLRIGASERIAPVRLDVTNASEIDAAFEKITRAVGRAGLTALINNAGVSVSGPVEIIPIEDWRQQFEINVFGQVAVTKHAIPLVRAATGRIVFVSSISGRVAPAFLGPYAASKFAIEGIAQALRGELRPWGIRVAVIEPGIIDTPIWHKRDDARVARLVALPGVKFYRDLFAQSETIAGALVARASPVALVTNAIENALTAAHPKHRYLVGEDARVKGALSRYLPDRVFDRIFPYLPARWQ
jgi:NAD(P)-dependent dehydrogenase (short-subunit alcohol dehydrogenase family)